MVGNDVVKGLSWIHTLCYVSCLSSSGTREMQQGVWGRLGLVTVLLYVAVLVCRHFGLVWLHRAL